MQRIYEPNDLFEGEMLIGMLAAEGITAHLAGRHLVGAIGELPACGLLGIEVATDAAERARSLIDAYNSAQLVVDHDAPDELPGTLLC